MLGNVSLFYAFWILIFHCCDKSTTLQVTSVQTFVGWNASFSMQLVPYPSIESAIRISKNGVLIMYARGTGSTNVADRFEFTGNTYENRISFILRNVTLGDAGTYTATEAGYPPGGEQKLIVKASPSKPWIVAVTGSAVLGSDYRLSCSSVSNSAPPDHGLTMMSEWKVNDQLITAGGRYKVHGTELTIASLTRQDNNGRLTCVTYEDPLAKSVPSNEHVIDVKYGPENVQLNTSGGIIRAIENHSVIIQCTADCNPTCSFQWKRESFPGYLKRNQTFMIASVGKSDTDNYTCVVSSSITGRSQSLQTTLVVIYNTASESVSRTSSLHDSTDIPDRQIRDVRRRRGIRRRESIKLGTGRESIRRGTGRESSRRGTKRESGSRGRGRVIRQWRGRGNQGPSLSRTKVALTAEARDHQLKEQIASMTKAEKDDILARLCQKHPNMVFELIDGSSMEQQGYHPRPGGESPSWCLCNNCHEMPTDEEKQCCKQIEDFDLVVLDEVVLLVAQRYRQDVLATEEDDGYNRGKRHTAYRQFILWTFGYLGVGNRRIIPSCCVWRIRDKYPDSFGQYCGFIQGRLG